MLILAGRERAGIWLVIVLRRLFNANLSSRVSIASERWLLDMFEDYGAALGCVNCVVAADISTRAGNFGAASLAN